MPWGSVEISGDGETLVFTVGTQCESLVEVQWGGDPAVDERVTATVVVRRMTRRDGHDVFCMSQAVGPLTTPAPRGIRPDVVIVDGAERTPQCPVPVNQRLDDPPTEPDSSAAAC